MQFRESDYWAALRDSDTTEVTLVVPSTSLGELYAFAASLHSGNEEPPTATEEEASPKNAPRQRAAAGFGTATVRKNYLGGRSDVWRPFLEELAEHAGEWVEWTELCAAVDRSPRQASGMLGAAERRCKQLPPYEKAYEDGQYWFRMPTEVAAVITELAS